MRYESGLEYSEQVCMLLVPLGACRVTGVGTVSKFYNLLVLLSTVTVLYIVHC